MKKNLDKTIEEKNLNNTLQLCAFCNTFYPEDKLYKCYICNKYFCDKCNTFCLTCLKEIKCPNCICILNKEGVDY